MHLKLVPAFVNIPHIYITYQEPGLRNNGFASVERKVVATLGKIDLETHSSLKKTERQIMLHQNEKTQGMGGRKGKRPRSCSLGPH